MSLGCAGPAGSSGSGSYAQDCNVTVVGGVDYFNVALQTVTVGYTAPTTPSGIANAQMQKVSLGGIAATNVYFVLTGGTTKTEVFIDDLEYTTMQ